MKEITVERVMTGAEASRLVGTDPGAHDPFVAREATRWTEPSGEVVALVLPTKRAVELRRAVRSVKMGTTLRAGKGLRNRSRTFGSAPRKPVLWREGCSSTSLARERPDVMAVLSGVANDLAIEMESFAVDASLDSAAAVAQVKPEWRLSEETYWTSGVINDTSELPYHRDSFNFDAWSAMPVLRRGVRGGGLHLPEYDLTFECRDAMTVFFSGYRLVHGVTPIERVEKDGYRYSVVFYALRGMKDCFSAAEETRYANRKRTTREKSS